MSPHARVEAASAVWQTGRVVGTRIDRATWALLFGTALVTLLLSRWLTPSVSGLGTHTQLGLPPCGMYAWFDIPCPACGLTTAFAHLAHGDVLSSLRANPLGLPLFLMTLACLPLSALAFVRRASVTRAVDVLKADQVALVFVFALLSTWFVRVLSIWL